METRVKEEKEAHLISPQRFTPCADVVAVNIRVKFENDNDILKETENVLDELIDKSQKDSLWRPNDKSSFIREREFYDKVGASLLGSNLLTTIASRRKDVPAAPMRPTYLPVGMGKVCAFIRFNLTFDFSFHTSELEAATNGFHFIASNSSFRAIRKLTHHGMLFLPIGRTVGRGMFGIDEAKGASSYGASCDCVVLGCDDPLTMLCCLRKWKDGRVREFLASSTAMSVDTTSINLSQFCRDAILRGSVETEGQSSSVAHKQSVTTHRLNTDPDAEHQGTSSPCDPFSLLTKV
ncbi:hypothetical protein Tco_0581178 [Tanacetum coccineum]